MKKMRKIISTLLALSMLTAIPTATSVFAENTTNDTNTTEKFSYITLAHEDFSAYKDITYVDSTDGKTKYYSLNAYEPEINGGYGWDGKLYPNTNKEITTFSESNGFANVEVIGVYGYSANAYRDLKNEISLSKEGTYVFETKLLTNQVYDNALAGLKLMSSDYKEIMSFGIFGKTEKIDGTDKSYYVPCFKVGDKEFTSETKLDSGNIWHTAKVVVTVNPNGNDTISYTIDNNNKEDVTLSSSDVELGTGSIKVVDFSWGQPTYIHSVTIKQKVLGSVEHYGEATVAQDDFLVQEYGYDSTKKDPTTGKTIFNPSASLGTGWNGAWVVPANGELRYYYDSGWRSNIICFENSSSGTIYRNLENKIDFSKDGKYEIRWKSNGFNHGGEKDKGVSLATGNKNILTFGINSVNSNNYYAITKNAIGNTGTVLADSSSNNIIFNTALSEFIAEITINPNGKDTIKFKNAANDSWAVTAEVELDGYTIDNVKVLYYGGGISNISIKSNAVTAIKQETENGGKVYLDFSVPSKDNEVTFNNAKISYVKDADGKIYSAVVEYTTDSLLANLTNEIKVGDVSIPVDFDYSAYPTTKVTDTIISDDFSDYIDESLKGTADRYNVTDYTKLNGGKGLKDSWNGSNFALGNVDSEKGIWNLSSGSSLTRNLEKEIDFSKDGIYEISFDFMRQYGWSALSGIKLLNSEDQAVFTFGLIGLTNIQGNEDKISDKERPIVFAAQFNGETAYNQSEEFAKGGLGNNLYTFKAYIEVNSEGNDEIKMKCFKKGMNEPENWNYVLSSKDLGNVKASKLILNSGVPGGFANVNIKKDIVSYRKTSEKAYMFFDNDYVASTNTAFGVSYTDDKTLSDVKYASNAKDFTMTFGSDNEIKLFVWDSNLKPVLSPITITK